jgi:hypothetical protein
MKKKYRNSFYLFKRNYCCGFFFRAVAKIMKDFETDPKVGAKIPEDLLEIIRLVIVGKGNSFFS